MQTDPNNTGTDQIVDGGAPTDEEARLAAQLPTIGENPDTDPDAAPPPAEAGGGEAAPPADPQAEPPPADPEPATATPPRQQPPAAEPPQPPRDFEAAAAEVQRRFDEGEIDGDAFQKELRAIAREESAFAARLEIYKERQQSAAQQAEADFAAEALAWEQQNAQFMANPLRAKAMQDAILAVEQETPGLAPAELLANAQTIAFEAYGYTPPAPVTPTGKTPAQAIADAKKDRQPPRVPPTLGSAPTAAQVDAPTTSAYAELDARDIDSLENQIAKMNPAQVEAYLADAPGAKSTGRE